MSIPISRPWPASKGAASPTSHPLGGTFDRGGLGNTICNINGVNFTNLLGTSTVTGATFTRSNTIQFRVNNNTATNFAGTLDTLTVSGTTWNDHNVAVSGGTLCFGDHLSVNSDTGGNFRLIVNSTSGINNVNPDNDVRAPVSACRPRPAERTEDGRVGDRVEDQKQHRGRGHRQYR